MDYSSNLGIQVIDMLIPEKWKRSRNYVIFMGEGGRQKSMKYQFAVKNDQLKLLKKNKKGEIEIFAFFERDNKLKIDVSAN